MELTNKQLEGLQIVLDRYKHKEKYACIAGYAGVGKTTLISFIVDALQVDPERVAYVAYTGKAAQVLRQKGCQNATTAHKLIYYATRMPNGAFYYSKRPKYEILKAYDLIVIDEISMLPKDMWETILSYGVFILASGDPAQLPPISADTDNHVLDNPHVFLDEIVRQAQESDIIKVSMMVREGKTIPTMKGNDILIIPKNEVSIDHYAWADQIICATNKTRNDINDIMRQSKNYLNQPVIGDKVISLTNHWETISNSGQALTNGTIGYLEKIEMDTFKIPRRVQYPRDSMADIMYATVRTEDDDIFEQVPIDYFSIIHGEPFLTPRQEYQLYKGHSEQEDTLFNFAYGYAVTCWKAQGSQWDKVLLIIENWPREKDLLKRYIYTGVTRAANKIVVVKT